MSAIRLLATRYLKVLLCECIGSPVTANLAYRQVICLAHYVDEGDKVAIELQCDAITPIGIDLTCGFDNTYPASEQPPSDRYDFLSVIECADLR
jgi:hypothetical protein